MIVQLIPKEKFTYGFITFMERYYSDRDMRIILYGDDSYFGYKNKKSRLVVSISKISELVFNPAYRRLLREADYILMNWVSSRVVPLLYPYRKKLVLFFWGADLYSVIRPESFMFKLANVIKRKVIAQAPYIMTIVPSDFELLCRTCKVSAKWMLGVVWDSKESDRTVNLDLCCNKSRSCLKILVGNSATKSNRHYEALDLLSHFANEDIEIILPLSYGDSRYADDVAIYAESIFGNKVSVLRDFISEEEYTLLLDQIDIGIFNHDRQQGLGTIMMLFRAGAKVYLSQDSLMSEDLIDEGYVIYPTENISMEKFRDFSIYPKKEKDRNKELADFDRNEQQAVETWNKIFHELEGNS